jgi:hydroxypyruvate isomerase
MIDKGEGMAMTNGNLARRPGQSARGQIKPSLVYWCLEPYWNDIGEMIGVAERLGCESIELVDPKHFPKLREHGLACAIVPIDMGEGAPFVRGFNNPRHHDEVIEATRRAIDQCAAFGYERVITFTGMSDGIDEEAGAHNCVAGYKRIVGYAESKGVTLCLEMLNTREDSHPMKGHPGYQGNHTEYCIDIIKRVGSPHLKLLFDVYHVQIMDGDVIRRINQHKDYIGHVHIAGNPGRHELDEYQELSAKAIMRALVRAGYDGYVGLEFIPTRDPYTSFAEAVALCDVRQADTIEA